MPVGFKCVRCGACCEWEGAVRVGEREITAIADFLHMDECEFIAEHTCVADDRGSLSLIEKLDGSCEYYDSEGKSCMINPVKPEQCASFPASWSFHGWEKLCAGAKQSMPPSSAPEESQVHPTSGPLAKKGSPRPSRAPKDV